MSQRYNNPDLYKTCSLCKIYKHIFYFRFKEEKCRLCIYLQRFRFHHTKDKFKEHVLKYNIDPAHVVEKFPVLQS